MAENNRIVHPYIPNSTPEVRQELLDYVGAPETEEFYEDIPKKLRLDRAMNLPEPLRSEQELKRHVASLLNANTSAEEILSFLGAGCYQHHVPAICDEVNQRAEFLTAYAGEPYDDHGRFQALFEYTSMMGDLLEMDVVNVPTYDGYQAAATSIRMASRITGRKTILINSAINPGKLSKIRDYSGSDLSIEIVDYEDDTGQVSLGTLEDRITDDTAAIYMENPNFFGVVEENGDVLADMGHSRGVLLVVSVNPITLGVLAPPANYDADIVCGDIQPLGMHMQFGGGQAGFIATKDDPEFVMEYPSRLFGITPTKVPGEYGFGDVAYDRTSFAKREGGKEWVGTAAALWGITAGVYLALMGPQGMVDIGRSIVTRVNYAIQLVGQIEGLRVLFPKSAKFNEFVVNYDESGKSAGEIGRELLAMGIQGGLDISADFPELGESALYCVTEVHTKNDLDRLAQALMEVAGS
jgi:glycine dehydrogenase subunit 1